MTSISFSYHFIFLIICFDVLSTILFLQLYIRGRGVLPQEMSRIDIEFHGPYGDENGGEMTDYSYDFLHSEAALNCHFAARGMPRNLISSNKKNEIIEDEEDDEFSPSFLWGSVYSLGGLFFSNSSTGSGSSNLSQPDENKAVMNKIILDGNSSMLTNRLHVDNNDVLDVPNSIPKNVGNAYDNLLRISVAASGANDLLLYNTLEVDAAEFTIIITTQLNILKDLIEELLNNKVISNISITKNHPQYYQYYEALCISGNKEIDAVLLLTWISRIIEINKERIHLIWSNMHGR